MRKKSCARSTLQNTILPQDLTEIINALRQLLDLRRVQQFNGQNAIIIRDTPDKVDARGEKIIQDIDKPKPEVVIEFAVAADGPKQNARFGRQPGNLGSAGIFAAVHIHFDDDLLHFH